jgi:hypothetical protein
VNTEEYVEIKLWEINAGELFSQNNFGVKSLKNAGFSKFLI